MILTTTLVLALLAVALVAYVDHKRSLTKIEAIRAAAKKEIATLRERIETMRAQITTTNNALQLAQDALQRHDIKRNLEAMLDSNAARTPTNDVLTSAGFADTLPADGWLPTQPASGFQHTRQEQIPGIIGLQPHGRR
jgi:cell division protein FtsB